MCRQDSRDAPRTPALPPSCRCAAPTRLNTLHTQKEVNEEKPKSEWNWHVIRSYIPCNDYNCGQNRNRESKVATRRQLALSVSHYKNVHCRSY
jgi:hypothetical protein